MSTTYRRERNSVTELQAHLVCTTKYRKKCIDADGLLSIKASFERVAESMNFRIREFNGESNHIHCLIEYPPVLSISKIFNHLKGVSSRNYKKEGHRMPSEKSLWTNSKFAVSVGGATIETIKEYIQSQDAPE